MNHALQGRRPRLGFLLEPRGGSSLACVPVEPRPLRELAHHHGLPSTHWTAIRACTGTGTQAQAAREVLCRDYWYPVFAHFRRVGSQTHNAEDLTQDFFAHILGGNWLEQADGSKGRFRSFLFTAANNFLKDQHALRKALKREGSYRHVPLDLSEARSARIPVPGEGGGALADSFDFDWAAAMVDASLHKLEAEFVQAGKHAVFAALKVYLTTEGDAVAYGTTGQLLGQSPENVKVAVHRLRRQYGTILQAEVIKTVASHEDVAEEMRYIRRVFAAKTVVAA